MSNIKDFLQKDLFAAHAGVELIEARAGYAKTRMNIKPFHLNTVGMVQGGAMFTLADLAFAAASNAYGAIALSIESSIYYHKGTREGVLYAEAFERSNSKSFCTLEVLITNEKDEKIATFTGIAYRKNGEPRIYNESFIN